MYKTSRSIMVMLVLILLMAVSPSNLLAQSMSASPETQLDEDDGLLYDAEIYAQNQGVSVEEALYRFHMQDVAGELEAKLSENETETFAGLWIEHTPEFKVVVLFTEDGEKSIEPYLTDELVNAVDVRSAKMSLVELQNVQKEFVSSLSGMKIPVDSEINVYQNNIELFVTEVDKNNLENALQDASVNVPDYIKISTVHELSEPTENIYGGLPLNKCNTAFSVQDIYNVLGRGITTAGHCGDNNYIIKYNPSCYLV